MSIIRKIVTGAAWNVFGQVGRQVISLGTLAILARLLQPEDFGLVAMSYSIRALAYIFATMGMGSAIIQKREIDDVYLSTAYWTTFLAGFVIAGAVAGVSPIVAWFFKRPELTWIIAIVSATFVLGGISSTHRDLLERYMRFKHISIIDICGSFTGSVVAIIMALKGMGYWSLVGREIVATAFRVPLLWIATKWRPRFVFSKSCFRNLFGFSSYVLMSNFLNFFNRNADNIIIGKVLGATPLAYYDLAYSLMLKPLQYVSYTISRSLFPGLSQIQEDKARVRTTYLQMIKIISIITFPMMLGLGVLSEEAVLLVYGPRWHPAVDVFRILCLVGMFQSIGTTVGTIYLSQGRPSTAFKMSLLISPTIWISFWLGTNWGINGVAICYATVSMSWWLISHEVANRIIELRMRYFLLSLWPALSRGIIMAIAVWLVRSFLATHNFTLLARVGLIPFVGFLLYTAMMLFSNDRDVISLRKTIFFRFRSIFYATS